MNPDKINIEDYLKDAFSNGEAFDLDAAQKRRILEYSKSAGKARVGTYFAKTAFAAIAACIAIALISAFLQAKYETKKQHREFVFNRDSDRKIYAEGRTLVFQNSNAEIISVRSSEYKFDRHYEEAVASMSTLKYKLRHVASNTPQDRKGERNSEE